MPIKARPGPKGGGFVATYGGKKRTFKTRAEAEKWADTYKVGGKNFSLGKPTKVPRARTSPSEDPDKPYRKRPAGKKGYVAPKKKKRKSAQTKSTSDRLWRTQRYN